MPPPYRLYAVDLDGTLLSPDGAVSDRNRGAIQAIRDAGHDVLVATGRTLMETIGALESIKHEGHVVAAGGSLLCHRSGETLRRQTLSVDVVEHAVTRLLEHGHRPLLLKDRHVAGYDYLTIGNAPLDPASEWWFEVSPVTIRHASELSADEHPDDTLRIGAVANGDSITGVVNALFTELDGRAHMQHWPAVTSTHAIGATTHLLEIFRPNTDKWWMIDEYCRMRGIATENVVAIGDGLNDVEMIDRAGLGIAMGNAIDAVKGNAARITGHHAEDGFADAVEHVLAGRWM